MYTIIPEKTAIKTGVCKSALFLNKEEYKNKLIVDYGAGKLRNTIYLQDNGFKVIPVDTLFQTQTWSSEYKENNKYYTINNFKEILGKADVVMCSYVLNVISSTKERGIILNNIKDILNENGIVLIDVRGVNSLKSTKNKIKYLDGYIVGKNNNKTFQKEFKKEELINLLIDNGFEILNIQSKNQNINALCKLKELNKNENRSNEF